MAQAPPTMSALRAQYDRLQREYRTMVSQAQTLRDATALTSAVNNIQAKNRELQTTLDAMLGVLSSTIATSSTSIGTEQERLQKRLQEVQEDYNKLLTNNDKLETLKRIRAYEESKVDTKIQLYLMAFIASLVLLFIVIFAFGYRRNSATAPTPAMSSATASFM
jgi:DNA repair exonuclease SbcCD ATPase subunit